MYEISTSVKFERPEKLWGGPRSIGDPERAGRRVKIPGISDEKSA